jgi:DNA-binding FadR family transcriptional regulator
MRRLIELWGNRWSTSTVGTNSALVRRFTTRTSPLTDILIVMSDSGGEKLTFVEPVEATRAFERAATSLVEGIERAHLRRGDRLPTELQLAEQLGISQPTVRQALRLLADHGLIEVRRGYSGGLFVASDIVPASLIGDLVIPDDDEVVEVLRARRAIEEAAVALAVDAADERDFADIEYTTTLMEPLLGQGSAMADADAAFHRAVIRASHNRPLERAMRAIDRDLAPVRVAYPAGAAKHAAILDIHRRQLDAMRRGDREELFVVLDEHLRMLEDVFATATGHGWSDLFDSRPRARAAGPSA